MDLDFDSNIIITCPECCAQFSISDCDEVNEASSSVRCSSCGRWCFVDCPSIFQSYVDQTLEEDEGGKLYDFRTGKLEDEFPDYRFKRIHRKPEEKKEFKKEQLKMIKQLKKDYKRVMGIKD